MALVSRFRLRLPAIPVLQPAQSRAILQREVGTAMHNVVEQIADAARQRTPVNTGLLRGSIATRVTQGVEATTLVRGEVFTGQQAPYALFVEEGTRPGVWRPIAPLKLWARRVLGEERAAYRVRWAIFRRGTRGRHMFREALTLVRPRIEPLIRAAVAHAARLLEGR